MALPTLNELLIAQWHPTKNYPLSPSDVTHGSTKRVWWQCNLGHDWEASPNARSSNSKNANGCPVCANQKVLEGYNDLATLSPAIAEEWHPALNGDLLPIHVMSKSHKKAWWQGKQCKHSWQAAIAHRVSANSGCPFCAGKKVLRGYNDLASQHPHLATEWHPSKNIIAPSSITTNSSKKVWWMGKCNHEWEAVIKSRVMGTGCPFCINYKVLSGYNDLATLRPSLVPQWHPTKNGILSPDMVFAYSLKPLWWQCKTGHEWKRSVSDRRKKNECPFCKNKRVLVGYNDLATTHPEISVQWHPTKNSPLLPTDISYGSSKKIWWICNKWHEWQVAANQRVSYSTECPDCAVRIFVSRAENEIAQTLLDNDLDIIQSDRRTVKNHELDIYVPAKNIAIEYNGLYWHTERAGRGQTYHYDKWLAAKNAGIQLIQVWEDEWNRNPEQVKAMLLHKLGVSNQEKVFARNTMVANLVKSDVESFLNMNHIQGYASGSCYIGLRVKGTSELVAVIILRKAANGTLNIVRYAASKNVAGGFTKLLKHAELTLSPARFVTSSDNCVSDGSLYANNGFIADKELAPDYRYVVKGERKQKSDYRLKRFREDPLLQRKDGLTEKKLADLNNIPRIWDAGGIRWVKRIL